MLNEIARMQALAGLRPTSQFSGYYSNLKEDMEGGSGVSYIVINFESRGVLGEVSSATAPSKEAMGEKLKRDGSEYVKVHGSGRGDQYTVCEYKNGWAVTNMVDELQTYYIDINCPELDQWGQARGGDWALSDIGENEAYEIVDACDMHNELGCDEIG